MYKLISLITSEKQMSNNYAPCFNIIIYIIPSNIEFPYDE